MSSQQLIFTDYNCFDELRRTSFDCPPLLVSFNTNLVTGHHYAGIDTAHIESYVDGTSELISDSDYALMREWLSDLWYHRGIDGGLLIQNSFIFLYAKQFIRQFRMVRCAIESIEPGSVTVYTKTKPLYDFFEVGDERVCVPIVARLCSHFDLDLTVESRLNQNRVTDEVFRVIGPSALRLIDTVTDGVTKYRSGGCYGEADILFHLANTNNLNVIKPVLEELHRRNTNLLTTYQSHGIGNVDWSQIDTVRDSVPFPVTAFESFNDRSVFQQLCGGLSDFDDEQRQLNTDNSSFELDGIPVSEAMREQMWLYYNFHFPRVRKYIETSINLLNRTKPSVVLLKADGPTPVRTIANVANKRSIPTVLVQHGLEKPISDYVPDSEHIAVWGEQSKAFFQAKGISDDRIHVTGAPHFDYLQSFKCDETQIKISLDIPEDHDVVMLASQVFDNAIRRQLIDAAINSVEKLQDVSLILRPHPREDRKLHIQAAESTSANVAVAPKMNIHDILTTSDVLLAIRSTVILEACLLGTPVLLLTFTAEKTNPFYSADNGFPEIDDPSELMSYIKSVLNADDRTYRERQPSFGRRFAHNADAKATDRIVNLIQRISDQRL